MPGAWTSGLVLVPHPDDPEYGIAAAVARWTREGRAVSYALASSGEVGIAGMDPAEAGPLRREEQRASAAIVGVAHVEFWGFPDSEIRNTPELRAKIAETIRRIRPEIVLSMYGGPQWAPGYPNQRDHIEFSEAVVEAWDSLNEPPRWLFVGGPEADHVCAVSHEDVQAATRALAAHEGYLRVLDPATPVAVQAQRQVEMVTPALTSYPGAANLVGDEAEPEQRVVGFQLIRG